MNRILAGAVVLGSMAFGVGPAMADMGQPEPSGHHHDRGDFLPWQGGGFGGYGVSGPGASQQQQPKVYDIAPAVAQAAFAVAEYDNRWIGLQVMLERARGDYFASAEYLSARKDMGEAQNAYDSASDAVMARLANDQNYRKLVEQRTQEQIDLKSADVDSGLRNVVASEKLRYGAMASRMEAYAMANDSAVQDAKNRLVAAQGALTAKERQFESQLFNRPEIVAARQSMEMARANKAGAVGYLRGAEVTRADQIDVNSQVYGGNTVVVGPWGPYYRGYFGFGAF
jgi:hypothetical protein